MQKLFENWRKYKEQVLKEIEEKDWAAAKDADSPLRNFENYDIDGLPIHQYLVVFRSNDVYELTADLTHAGMSHAIKHIRETTPGGEGVMNDALNVAADEILNMPDEKVFIYRLGKIRTKRGKVKVLVPKEIYLDGQDAKDFIIDHTDIIQNTFDFINDKYLKDDASLNSEERQLLPMIEEITNKYYELIEKHRGSFIEITDDMSVEQISEILNNRSIIKFKATFGRDAVSREYIFDLDGGEIFSIGEEGGIKTFFVVGADRGTPRTLHTYFCYLHAGLLGPLGVCGGGDKKLNKKLAAGSMALQQQNLIQAFEQVTGLSTKSTPDVSTGVPAVRQRDIIEDLINIKDEKELARYIVDNHEEVVKYVIEQVLPGGQLTGAFQLLDNEEWRKDTSEFVYGILEREVEVLMEVIKKLLAGDIAGAKVLIMEVLVREVGGWLEKAWNSAIKPTPEEDAARATELSRQHLSKAVDRPLPKLNENKLIISFKRPLNDKNMFENWSRYINEDISLSDSDIKELKTIKDELDAASKMHKGQSKRIESIIKDLVEEELEAVLNEKAIEEQTYDAREPSPAELVQAYFTHGEPEKKKHKAELSYSEKRALKLAQDDDDEGWGPWSLEEGELEEKVDKKNMACNKPRRTSSHKGKSHVVKACKGGKEKIIPFGEKGASTAGAPKAGESERMKAKRKSFKSRHGKNIKKGNMSAAYWSDKVKW